MASGFCEGDNARVHHDDHPGGGLSCIARCRLGCTHSLLWPRVVVAKPNHGFFRCQHPSSPRWRRPPRIIAIAQAESATRERDAIDDGNGNTSNVAPEIACFKCFAHSTCTPRNARGNLRDLLRRDAAGRGIHVYVACRRVHGSRPGWRRNDRIARKCAGFFRHVHAPERRTPGSARRSRRRCRAARGDRSHHSSPSISAA